MGSNGNNSCACETGGESSNAAATTAITAAVEATPRRTLDTFGHRLTGKYEAHLWDNSCRREGQSRKGRQVTIFLNVATWNLMSSHRGNEVLEIADFLGMTRMENQSSDPIAFNEIQPSDSNYLFSAKCLLTVQNTLAAAAATSNTSFDFQQNANHNFQSLTLSMGSCGNNSCACETSGESSNAAATISITAAVEAALRRTLDTFGPRTSIYRGIDWQGGMKPIFEIIVVEGKNSWGRVIKTPPTWKWQMRIGRVARNKDLYLGTFSAKEEAAEAYDIAAIKFRGLNAVTNFDMSRYNVRAILESNTLPIGGRAAKRLKEAQAIESSRKRDELIALNSGLHHPYGSLGSSRLQAYPLLQYEQQQPQPLLSLQNHNISLPHFAHDTQFQQNYIQTQLQLHQLSSSNANNAQLYGHLYQNNPASVHGLMRMGSSSTSVMETDGGSSGGSYNGGGYLGNCGVWMGLNSRASNPAGSSSLAVDSHPELAVVKVDYDQMPSGSGGYGRWSANSVQGPNPSVFSMWND
ncbi:hypothetical protein Ancab_016214 [Ancistrocladus abbreviatus]